MLTCEQVNAELARRRGETGQGWDTMSLRIPLYNGSIIEAPPVSVPCDPDYCHDWRWAGVLLEEMVAWPAGSSEYYAGYWAFYHAESDQPWELWLNPTMVGHRWMADGSTPTEAIARARLAMYEEGEE